MGTTEDPEAAKQRLLRGEVDAVITVPPDPLGTVAQGQQATLYVTYDTINPVFGTAVPERTYGLLQSLNQSIVQANISRGLENVSSIQEQVDELNRQLEELDRAVDAFSSEDARATTAQLDDTLGTLEGSLKVLQNVPGETGEQASTALDQVQTSREQLEEVRTLQEGGPEEIKDRTSISDLEQALADLQDTLAGIPDAPAWVLANPLRADLENLSSPPSLVGFYTPGVLSLLIQHLAVSLASLSIIRERLNGAYEFFEVSPLGAGELLAGKFLTYFGLVLGVNLAVVAVLATFLSVPIEGGVWRMILVMILLTVASLGLGFLVSTLAKSQMQAVQISMLLLIGSAFFGGFLLPLSDMKQPGIAISYFLPATYGLRGLKDVMIRGDAISSFDLAGLVMIAVICLGLARYLVIRKKL